MCVAAWLHGLEMQQYEPASRNSATMLNLEDLGMSQIEPRRPGRSWRSRRQHLTDQKIVLVS